MIDVSVLGVEVRPKGVVSTTSKLKKLGDVAQSVEGKTERAGKSISNFGSTLTKYLTLPLGAGAVASFKFASSLEKQQKVFDILIGDLKESNKLFKDIQNFSAKTPFQLEELTKATEVLLATGTATDQITEKLNILGNVALGDSEKLARLSDAYTKLQTKGRASLEEINRFTEAGVPILDQLAKNLNVSKEELFKFISAGKLGFKDVDKALTDLATGTGKFAGLLEEVSNTSSGKLSTAIDNVKLSLADLGKEFLPVAIELIDEVTELAKEFRDLDQDTKDSIITFGKYAIILPVLINGFGKLTTAVSSFSKAINFATSTKLAKGLKDIVGTSKETAKAFKALSTSSLGFKKVSAEFLTKNYIGNINRQLTSLATISGNTSTKIAGVSNGFSAFGSGLTKILGVLTPSLAVGGAFFGLLALLSDTNEELETAKKYTNTLKKYVDTATDSYDKYATALINAKTNQTKLTEAQKKALQSTGLQARINALDLLPIFKGASSDDGAISRAKSLEEEARKIKATYERFGGDFARIKSAVLNKISLSGQAYEDVSGLSVALFEGDYSDVQKRITKRKVQAQKLRDEFQNTKEILAKVFATGQITMADLKGAGLDFNQRTNIEILSRDYAINVVEDVAKGIEEGTKSSSEKNKKVIKDTFNDELKDLIESSRTELEKVVDEISSGTSVIQEAFDRGDLTDLEAEDLNYKTIMKSLLGLGIDVDREKVARELTETLEADKAEIANKILSSISKEPLSANKITAEELSFEKPKTEVDLFRESIDKLNASLKETFVDGLQNTYLDTFGALGEAIGSNTSGLDSMSNAIKKNAMAILSSLGPMFTEAGVRAITKGIIEDRPDLIGLGSGLIATGGLSSFSAGVIRGEQGTGSFANNQKEVVTTTPQSSYTGSTTTKFSPNINVINNTGAKVETRTDESGNIDVYVNNSVISGMQSGAYSQYGIEPNGTKVG